MNENSNYTERIRDIGCAISARISPRCEYSELPRDERTEDRLAICMLNWMERRDAGPS
jgi:hypothetical protein